MIDANLFHKVDGHIHITIPQFMTAERKQCAGICFLRHLQCQSAVLSSFQLEGMLDVPGAHVDSGRPVFVRVNFIEEAILLGFLDAAATASSIGQPLLLLLAEFQLLAELSEGCGTGRGGGAREGRAGLATRGLRNRKNLFEATPTVIIFTTLRKSPTSP